MKNRRKNHDDWATPKPFYEALNRIFNFDFDPCPLRAKFDGLSIDWGQRNFVNPPYSRKLKEAFIMKAIEQSQKAKLCVMLLPVSTSTKIFHDHVLPNKKWMKFVRGRLKFAGINSEGVYVDNKCGQGDSMLVIFDGREESEISYDG
jgi:site-specific DNA-methyltransferase (adenine-specific)